MAPRSDAILITGAGGFTGRPLAAALEARGHRVVGLSQEAGRPGDLTVNLADEAALTEAVLQVRPRVVVHLAAIAFAAHGDEEQIEQVNVGGTARLFQALSQAPPERVILASSAATYAPPNGAKPITEDHPQTPLNAYGRSKLAAERLGRSFSAYAPVQAVRPFNYTGPGQSPLFLVAKIVDHFARRAAEMQIGDLDLDRDLSSVDDMVDTYVRLVEGGGDDAPLNFCSGRTVRLGDLVVWMREISGHDPKVVVNPAFLRTGEPKTIVGSRERLERLLGVGPPEDFRETLERMYRAQLALAA